MRIAFLGPFGFHPNKTMRSRALPLARRLVELGHAVRIVMPPWQTPDEAGRRWEEEGVEIVYVKLSGGVPLIVRRMVREVDLFQPQIVHGFKPKAYSGLATWWLWQRRRLTGRGPALVTDTDDWEGWGGWNDVAPYSTAQKYFFAWQERWGLTHCDQLTAASRDLAERAAGLGRPAEEITYLPNGPGIPHEPPPPGDIERRRESLGLHGRPTVLLYSRLFEFDTGRLVDILARVQSAVPDLAILSIGTGLFDKDNAVLHKRFQAAGLLPAVVDLGWLRERELPAAILSADAALYLMDDTPLNRAKCPVKLADMVALGLPVAGEAVGQVKEYIIHDQTGLLAASGGVEPLADGLTMLLNDPVRRSAFAAAARAHARAHFSWQQLAEAALTAYARAAG